MVVVADAATLLRSRFDSGAMSTAALALDGGAQGGVGLSPAAFTILP